MALSRTLSDDKTPASPTPSIEVGKVPWDAAALKGRTCSNCACYFESVNPQDPKKFQGFCRRDPAELIQLRGEVPRMDLSGNPVMREGKPVMNSEVIVGFLYRQTQRDGTCFDGYRVPGSLPGERNIDVSLREFFPEFVQQLGRYLPPELVSAASRMFGISGEG